MMSEQKASTQRHPHAPRLPRPHSALYEGAWSTTRLQSNADEADRLAARKARKADVKVQGPFSLVLAKLGRRCDRKRCRATTWRCAPADKTAKRWKPCDCGVAHLQGRIALLQLQVFGGEEGLRSWEGGRRTLTSSFFTSF